MDNYLDRLIELGHILSVPYLFSDVVKLYGLDISIYYEKSLGSYGWTSFSSNNNPEFISIAYENFKIVVPGGNKLSNFNSKLFVLLHEIGHCLEGRGYIDLLLEKFDITKGFVYPHSILENAIDDFAFLEYRRIRSFVKPRRYEWKNSERPNIDVDSLKTNLRKKILESYSI